MALTPVDVDVLVDVDVVVDVDVDVDVAYDVLVLDSLVDEGLWRRCKTTISCWILPGMNS